MKFKLQLMIEDDQGQTCTEDIFQLSKNTLNNPGYGIGLSLRDSKHLLKKLQQHIVLHEAHAYTAHHRACSHCQKQRRIKGYHDLQYRTLFGIITIPSMRLYQCRHCQQANDKAKTYSVLQSWLPEHTSPELQYLETKWAAHMAYDKTAALLQDVLPIHANHNGETVRQHLHKTAQRQEAELEGKPICTSGCGNDWARLPKPDKPITVGIDGGYVRSCVDKKSNFEVIAGKSFSKTKPAKRFGFVQTEDEKPQRRYS